MLDDLLRNFLEDTDRTRDLALKVLPLCKELDEETKQRVAELLVARVPPHPPFGTLSVKEQEDE